MSTPVTRETEPATVNVGAQPRFCRARLKRHRGDHVAQRAEHAGGGHDDREAPRREVDGRETQHADEGERVTAAEQAAREQGHGERRHQRERDLGQAHQGRGRDQQPARSEPVDQDAGRDLHGRVHADLQHHEHAQLTRPDAEAVLGLKPGHPERRAVEDGQDVDEDGQTPAADGDRRCGAAAGAGRGRARSRRPGRGRVGALGAVVIAGPPAGPGCRRGVRWPRRRRRGRCRRRWRRGSPGARAGWPASARWCRRARSAVSSASRLATPMRSWRSRKEAYRRVRMALPADATIAAWNARSAAT